ncbi:MAG: TIR domain-containing protein [Oscillospiraceae bacterium]|nr:TIR domain-containing protein [Oscillospiraceae bacterium]
MAIIKCKMCGGDIALNEEKTFGTCEYCGSTMTLPKVSDEQRAARFNRGNHFRRQGEFDKALAVYESIVREDDADAEAHWCCALCRFGIEYVEDPNTFEYLPTCHRASFDSFLEDVDYKAALENSDGITRRQYQKDAAKIAEVQRGILATSQNEEPFDVFICYKETDDETKERTRDSIDAQEIYYQLTQEGYRVFFSRITLEDKAGTEYEPYIFAALNSAKVMVAIGSKPEYFNAVWVKNEWSRFLAMMRKDRSKLLLPCYKGMDPYDLPEQLGVLQSYDMTKIGFVQDLIRGIKKVLAKEEQKPEPVKETVVVRESAASAGPSAANLVRRGNLFLDEQNWASAEEYFNKALDIDAENAESYLGLTLANDKCKNLNEFALQCSARFTEETEETLEACEPETGRIDALASELEVQGYFTAEAIKKALEFSRSYPSREASARQNKEKTMSALREDRNYTRAKQFAAETLKQRLTEAEQAISGACDQRIENAKREADEAKESLAKQYLENLDKQEQSLREQSQKAQEQREADYQQACQRQEKAIIEEDFRAAVQAFAYVVDYKDANDRARQARLKADELKAEKENRIKWAEQERARKKKSSILVSGVVVVLVAIAIVVITTVIIPNVKYNGAMKLYEEGKCEEAIAAFESLNGYKDSIAQIERCKTAIKDKKYTAAVELYTAGKYEDAIAAFTALDGYKDSAAMINEIKSKYYMQLLSDASVGSRVFWGSYEQDNNTSNGKEDIEWIVLAREGDRVLVISRYALDCQQYNTSCTGVTWETGSLRWWLNGTFLNAAFSERERAMIPSVTVSADKTPSYSTSPGNSTTDQIFLLSITEANKYFTSDSARQCQGTAYCYAQGAIKTSNGNCWWWLRSPGSDSRLAASVFGDGSVDFSGFSVDFVNDAVRPALWISIEP